MYTRNHPRTRVTSTPPAVKGRARPPRIRRVVVAVGRRRKEGGSEGQSRVEEILNRQRTKASRHDQQARKPHTIVLTSPPRPGQPHATTRYGDPPQNTVANSYSTLGTAQRRPYGRGRCSFGGELTYWTTSIRRLRVGVCAT